MGHWCCQTVQWGHQFGPHTPVTSVVRRRPAYLSFKGTINSCCRCACAGWSRNVSVEAFVVNIRDAAAPDVEGLVNPLLKRCAAAVGIPASALQYHPNTILTVLSKAGPSLLGSKAANATQRRPVPLVMFADLLCCGLQVHCWWLPLQRVWFTCSPGTTGVFVHAPEN